MKYQGETANGEEIADQPIYEQTFCGECGELVECGEKCCGYQY
jgi:hypothetical protein